ncbi:MAG: hypothetical protein K5891_06235 [Lachnospiraceae bacterium]|nr:hypothetical protein [Lachnospiraceae bacterium]
MIILSILFICALISLAGRLAFFAIKASWKITKFLVSVVFFPVLLLFLLFKGAIVLALVGLLVFGLLSLVGGAVA